jgi:ubiquinol-cytochrome c reductase cytochrome c subunit
MVDRSGQADRSSARATPWSDAEAKASPPAIPDLLRAAGGYVALGLVVLFAWTSLTATVTASPGSPPPAGTVRQVSAGEALYQQSCAACHGPGGLGSQNGPEIATAGAALADLMLRSGRMPLAAPNVPDRRGRAQFSDSEIEALVAYVASLGEGPAIPQVVTDGADLANGRDLYTASCAACHGPAAGGGAVGGGFVAPDLGPATAVQVGEAALGGPGPMPRFSFSPDDLDDLAAYVESLHAAPNPGGATAPVVGPVVEGFVAGLALLVLLLVARSIAVRQRRMR